MENLSAFRWPGANCIATPMRYYPRSAMPEVFPVILFYKYVAISDPESFAASQRALCSALG